MGKKSTAALNENFHPVTPYSNSLIENKTRFLMWENILQKNDDLPAVVTNILTFDMVKMYHRAQRLRREWEPKRDSLNAVWHLWVAWGREEGREGLHGKENVNNDVQIERVLLERVAPEQNFERQKEFSYRCIENSRSLGSVEHLHLWSTEMERRRGKIQFMKAFS